ncbi:hypothetical protein NIES267_23450 [Calothrix parasitica NIES-267]|uniref:Lipoprotein n=1 Tax=Calothrix parasitica NIES-267 TaxID=1973488 RepID=A0A1Z4LNP7_9CYAN|nr:hypothetical protein NIES267_23450 [Calothrix parasitica NIES-267]
MKYTFIKLVRKLALVSVICLLVSSTTGCTDRPTNSTQIEIIKTPSTATNSSQTATTETPSDIESSTEELPAKLQSAVLSDAKKRVSKPVAELRIKKSEKQSWSDSCLGLAEPGKLCAQVIVPGWKVTVTDGQRELVYRTDNKGKLVKLEE